MGNEWSLKPLMELGGLKDTNMAANYSTSLTSMPPTTGIVTPYAPVAQVDRATVS
jgi:hypothetical protein